MREVRVRYDKRNNTYAVYWYDDEECVAEEGLIQESLAGIPLHEADVKWLKDEL